MTKKFSMSVFLKNVVFDIKKINKKRKRKKGGQKDRTERFYIIKMIKKSVTYIRYIQHTSFHIDHNYVRVYLLLQSC